MTQLVTVKMHGFLGEKYGKEITLAGDTVGQLMNGLKATFGPKFKEDIRANDWHLIKGDDLDNNPDELSKDELPLRLATKVLHLVPVVIGAAKKFIQIIIGIILVVVGAYFGQGWMVQLGVSMIIGGVVNLAFAPKPPGAGSSNPDEQGSYVFNGAVNITSQGGVKPILFGRVRRAGSVIISSDFSTDRVGQNVDPGTGSTDVIEETVHQIEDPPGGL